MLVRTSTSDVHKKRAIWRSGITEVGDSALWHTSPMTLVRFWAATSAGSALAGWYLSFHTQRCETLTPFYVQLDRPRRSRTRHNRFHLPHKSSTGPELNLS